MPSSLGLLHEELTHIFGDINWLIGEHTLYRFYCCGLPREKFEVQRRNLIERLPGPVRLCRHPLLFESSEQANKQCPECAEQQLKEYGTSFITLHSCFPFVNICGTHGEEMKSMRKQLLLFDDYCQAPPNKYQISMTKKLAKRIEACVDTPLEDMDTHMDDIIRLMKERGYIQENGRCQVDRLKADVEARFKGAFSDERLALLCSSPEMLDCMIRNLLREDRAVPPIYCVLLKMFLEDAVPVHKPVKSALKTAVQPSNIRSALNVMTKDEMEHLLVMHGSISEAAKQTGISKSKLTTICKRHAITRTWRPKNVSQDVAKKIQTAFIKGKTERELTAVFDLSLTTVYRVVELIGNISYIRLERKDAQHLADKEMYLQLREENPQLSRNDLKNHFPALWGRLYRHDKKWLALNSPPVLERKHHPHGPPPKALVEKLDAAVKDVADRLYNHETHPINGSPYQIRKNVGLSEHAFDSMTAAKLVVPQRYTRTETNNKRIELATQRNPAAKTDSTIARKANLRPTTVTPLLDKHR